MKSQRNGRQFTVKSKIGGSCKLRYFNIDKAVVKMMSGKATVTVKRKQDFIEIQTKAGDTYMINEIPSYQKARNLTDLKLSVHSKRSITLEWQTSPDAKGYHIYALFDNSPDYIRIVINIQPTQFLYRIPDNVTIRNMYLK